MSRFPQINKFKKEEKKLLKLLDTKIKIYEKSKKKAECGLCDSYQKELNKENVYGKMHKHCGNCKYRVLVTQAYQELLEAKSELDNFEEKKYGKTVFDLLSKEMPELIEEKTGKVVKWNDIFGRKYSDNIPGKRYKLLIGLFEKNMCTKYRLK